mmetsp:Transcript_15494/g.35364  ORF Transcript_15494/g.35364 Transcript_15494/m.35364 type:complete len:210 (+) Transcript_15494:55-684(+)
MLPGPCRLAGTRTLRRCTRACATVMGFTPSCLPSLCSCPRGRRSSVARPGSSATATLCCATRLRWAGPRSPIFLISTKACGAAQRLRRTTSGRRRSPDCRAHAGPSWSRLPGARAPRPRLRKPKPRRRRTARSQRRASAAPSGSSAPPAKTRRSSHRQRSRLPSACAARLRRQSAPPPPETACPTSRRRRAPSRPCGARTSAAEPGGWQ